MVISNNQSLVSQILRVIDPLGEKFDFFSPLGFDTERDSDLETSEFKFHSVASKGYLNEKILFLVDLNPSGTKGGGLF